MDAALQEITPKERILKRIREALTAAPVPVERAIDLDSPVFVPAGATLDVVFAENFVHRGGRFVYCENMEEALQSLRFLVEENGGATISSAGTNRWNPSCNGRESRMARNLRTAY